MGGLCMGGVPLLHECTPLAAYLGSVVLPNRGAAAVDWAPSRGGAVAVTAGPGGFGQGAPRMRRSPTGLADRIRQRRVITPRATSHTPITPAPITAAGRPLRPIQPLNLVTRSCVESGANT